jgi:cob(I)alamin adenosyltransferase
VGKVDFPEVILIYANRLSDYFFVLSRFINYKMGIEDELL